LLRRPKKIVLHVLRNATAWLQGRIAIGLRKPTVLRKFSQNDALIAKRGTATIMLIPRYTIRAILAVTTVAAFVFVIAGLAVRGHAWAWGVTFGVASLLLAMLVQAACYGIVWCFTRLVEKPAVAPPSSTPVASRESAT
jgi:hypothetical protein